MAYKDWLQVYITLIDGKLATCPECRSSKIKLKLAGNPNNRLGYGMLWCDDCKRGIWLSRIEIPEHLDFIPISEVKDEFVEADKIKLVSN